jgi:hypothetical protein
MTEVLLDPEADQELLRLESDPTAEKLLRRVNDMLDALERDTSDPALRRHRFSNGLWYVLIPYHQGDYALLWEPHGDAVAVRYLGPDFR